MNEEVKSYVGIGVKAATAIGVVGWSVAFWPAMVNIWISMLNTIADHYGKSLGKDQIGKIVTAAVAGAGVWMDGSGVVSKIIMGFVVLTFGAGLAAATVINSAINGFFTWRLGVVFDKLMTDQNAPQGIVELSELVIRNMASTPRLGEMREFISMYKMYRSRPGFFDECWVYARGK